MEGQAAAPAAGTILNALATGTGSAFAIDEYVTATVTLSGKQGVSGEIAGRDESDTRLIERCVELVVDRFGDGEGGVVRTESDVPPAAGLKSSSAAANATVMATLDALGAAEAVSCEAAARIGVQAARDVGVTVTGAFDDASASMLGGLTRTDNRADELLAHDDIEWDVLVWTPAQRAYSAEADVERCRRIAPVADLVAELALDGAYERAMTVNGFAFCGALGFSAEPLLEGLLGATGVSLSGTGPSFTAVGDRESLAAVQECWERRDGTTWLTETQSKGACIDD